MNKLLIAPSILSADFAKLGDEVREADRGGADWIHVDIMDGHFVPNLTFGPPVVEAIRPCTALPLDVHLMIEQPDRYIPAFAAAGADYISVHAEASVHLHRSVHLIRENGAKPGVVLNPATPLNAIDYVLDDIDYVLIMTVNPGFGGQSFIPVMLEKIHELRSRLAERGLERVLIEVDGGINVEIAPLVTAAGASVLVAGNAVFGQPDRRAQIEAIRKAGERADG